MRQFAGQGSGGIVWTVLSSTMLPSSQVSVGPSTFKIPHTGPDALSSPTTSSTNASTLPSITPARPGLLHGGGFSSALASEDDSLSLHFCIFVGSAAVPFFAAPDWRPRRHFAFVPAALISAASQTL